MDRQHASGSARLWERDRTPLFLGVAVVALLLAGALSALTLQGLDQSIERVGEARAIRFDLQRLLSQLEEAQRSQRGYILTGEERSLGPYLQASTEIEKDLRALSQTLRDRHKAFPQQMDEIAREARDVLAELQETIEIRRNLGFEAAVEQVQRSELAARFDDLTEQVTQLQNAEESSLTGYESAMKRQSRWATLGTLLLSLLSLGAFSAAAFRLRRAQRRLALSHSHLEGLIEGTPDLIVAVDQNYRFIAFNSAFAQTFEHLLGRRPQLGLDLLASVNGQGAYTERMRQRWGRALEGETYTVLEEVPGPDGAIHHHEVSYSAIRDDTGRLVGAASRTRDVTERVRLERELREHEAFLESIYNGTEAVIFVVDVTQDAAGAPDFHFTGVNATHQRLTGFGTSDLVGRRLEAIPGYLTEEAAASLRRNHDHCVQTGEVVQFEEMIPFQGQEMWWLTRLTPLAEDDGAVYRVVATALPITDRKKAEKALRRSKTALERSNWELERTNRELSHRNRELQDFAYVASHDLQEPLRKIRAFADLLTTEYEEKLDDTGRHYLERMDHAAERMSTLISDLLSFSRVTTRGRPFEMVNLNEVLAGVLSDLEMRLKETGGKVEEEGLCIIEADPTQMRQLFQNLIGNALKFHRPDEPPCVSITASIDTVPEFSKRPACRIRVADNGIGFEPQHADRIFTPFQRLHTRQKFEGTGIGLAICRRIVERHNGTIQAESNPDHGTIFTILLPSRQEASEAEDLRSQMGEGPKEEAPDAPQDAASPSPPKATAPAS